MEKVVFNLNILRNYENRTKLRTPLYFSYFRKNFVFRRDLWPSKNLRKALLPSVKRIREIGNALIAEKKLPNFHLSLLPIDLFIVEIVGQKEEQKDLDAKTF